MDEIKKKIDESWKNSAEKEKSVQNEPAPKQDFKMSFPVFVSSLGMQALAALGEMENPLTKKKELDLEQAKYMIEIIEILQEKTKGNLTSEESQMIEGLLYQLRMLYVSKAK
ncbi:MAG: DUF1844 domain-containing protein [Candidatus Omnitrophica bacterium CG12_big_fil_rev_8_21_14_0_65_43_15]|uniref:DUF1844 domain-containing protein n=1 Tax=Candidatus Taenaricola geysiri TaxID=1974752 RepID=A0A2J0LF96_9BACT|nr:MAG: DUF1844 domain-containing protein [Candidatus Omnitrophica bacterium CG10_big_fil_rev_8_21_14_0_10_43_8]PIV11647.1 MAG: DUF1844 domain-containing protein [Candidatus Omnitrophica bacterium CG03_land_8_20_14_0_80_43_22]PIW65889.1 MAG: DUF1844 domain-containing protein [Candidatus Omnitrophica bacterium CG12_big_fil_rev_8_21_14_0_65_43_15]PIW80085.1 MAG: DUF1844 domain-containing protein [Candidatus Omnitrophica bacterium CG_4_8_14_3_um_filter_43_15]PIY83810.1 MAG: DUF1844 domain-containi